MKLISKVNILSAMFLWSFIGCEVTELDDSSKNNGAATSSSSQDLTTLGPTETAVGGVSVQVMDASSDSYKVLKLNGDKNLQLKLGNDAKDVYVLFSNPSDSTKSAIVKHKQKISKNLNTFNKVSRVNNVNYFHAKKDIQNFNNRILDLKSDISSNKKVEKRYRKTTDKVNDSEIFYMKSTSQDEKVKAKAKKVITNIKTQFGEKSLTIWVEDDSYVSTCHKVKCVDDKMINTLANKFLKSGTDNDIYDWVTNVFGEEWGSSNSSELIEKPNHIDILLTDISNDNKTNGGVIGYFYSKDNFKASKYKGSNERIMFYIDSVMYANGTSSWDENDFWPQQVFSTLAHEFQHMIYFYQKNVKQGLQGTDSWFNEMLSESTEDLVAVNMNVDGPRNVAASRGDSGAVNNYNGRYPLFNKNNRLSPLSWDNTLENYSTVSSFGAYLLRNYGGAELLHNAVHNNLRNKDALMYAVHQHVNGKSKTFDDLIHEWGVAVLLSKRDDISTDAGVLYNAGDYISSDFNGIHYDLGSINFFNYKTQPLLATSMGKISPHSNYYYKVGENLRGDVNVDILGTTGLNVSVVVVK